MIISLRAVRLAAYSIALLPTLALGQRATTEVLQLRIDSLQRRTLELERRVSELEALLRMRSTSSPIETAVPRTRDLANWRRLRHSMMMDDVRALLGEPENVNAGPRLTIWAYPDDGSVTFLDSMVNGWVEPRRGDGATTQ